MSRHDWLLFACTSIGLIVVLPPFVFGFLAPFVLIPYFFLIEKKSYWNLTKVGYVVGLVWGMGTIYWVGWATVPGLFGALIVFAFSFAIFSLIQGWLYDVWGKHTLWLAPIVWYFTEWFSSQGPLAFPWNALAYSQTSYPVIIQFASYVGTFGVSFWIVWLNVILFHIIKYHSRKKVVLSFGSILFASIILPIVYGHHRIESKVSQKQEFSVALVQGDIDPYKKWTATFIDSNITIYEDLSTQTSDSTTDLIIWPETAIPGYLKHRYSYLKRIRGLVDSLQVPLLAGAPDYQWIKKGEAKVYNSVFLIEPNHWPMQQYSKMHLVPFSERVPLVSEFPLLYRLTKKLIMDIGDFSPGDSATVFSMNQSAHVKFATVICFDSVFPDHVRQLIRQGAQFLVIITNDGWFGRTSGPYQHAAMAVLRAVENGVAVVRCANTGVSCIIDRYGDVKEKTQLYTREVLRGDIDIRGNVTFYVRHGQHINQWVVLIMGIVGLITCLRQLMKKRGR